MGKIEFKEILYKGFNSGNVGVEIYAREVIEDAINNNYVPQLLADRLSNLKDYDSIPSFTFSWVKETGYGLIIGELNKLILAKKREREKIIYEKNFIETESELVDAIIHKDYWSELYTEDREISFNNIFTLIKFRNRVLKFKPFDKLTLTELHWDNWNDTPAIANKEKFKKKMIKDKVIIMNLGRSSKELYVLEYKGIHGIITTLHPSVGVLLEPNCPQCWKKWCNCNVAL